MKKIVRRTRRQVYDLWIAALRSGKYKQGLGLLNDEQGGFCCLGVLCDLAGRDGGPSWEGRQFMGRICSLPENLQRFMGISYSQEKELMRLNDHERRSFLGIASYIKANIAKD